MKQFLSKILSAALQPWHHMTSEQYSKVWLTAVMLVIGVLVTWVPAVAQYMIVTAACVVAIVCMGSFIVTHMFGNVERLEPLNKRFKVLGSWLASFYDESFKGDEADVHERQQV